MEVRDGFLVIRRILALTLVVTLASMGVPVPVNASGEQEQPSARNNVLTLNGQASASQRPPAKSDQQILVELEQGWNEAFYRKDVASLLLLRSWGGVWPTHMKLSNAFPMSGW